MKQKLTTEEYRQQLEAKSLEELMDEDEYYQHREEAIDSLVGEYEDEVRDFSDELLFGDDYELLREEWIDRLLAVWEETANS